MYLAFFLMYIALSVYRTAPASSSGGRREWTPSTYRSGENYLYLFILAIYNCIFYLSSFLIMFIALSVYRSAPASSFAGRRGWTRSTWSQRYTYLYLHFAPS